MVTRKIPGGKLVGVHRMVVEYYLGRELLPNEIPHHRDGDGLNNHPANLEVVSSVSEHSLLHVMMDRLSAEGVEPF